MGRSGKKAWNLKFSVHDFLYPYPTRSSMFSTELVLLCAWCPLVPSPLWDDVSRLWERHRRTAGHRAAGTPENSALSITFTTIPRASQAIHFYRDPSGSSRCLLRAPTFSGPLRVSLAPISLFASPQNVTFSPFPFSSSCRFMSMNKPLSEGDEAGDDPAHPHGLVSTISWKRQGSQQNCAVFKGWKDGP